MDDQMSEKDFRRILAPMLDGAQLVRAMAIFKLAGAEWGLPIVNAMSHAVDRGVLAETLQLLDRYFEERPMSEAEACHRIEVRVNPRTGVFLRIDGRSTPPL